MNDNQNIVFWTNFLIHFEPTIEYPHVCYRYKKLMMKNICCGNKIKFTKKVNILFFLFYTLSEDGVHVEICHTNK